MDAVGMLMRLLPKEMVIRAGEPPQDAIEMRLRAGKPVQWITMAGHFFRGEAVDGTLLQESVAAMAEHSLYARESELQEGYFTIRGGCRAGICGRFVRGEKDGIRLEEIGSVNVRIARAICGSADNVMPWLYNQGRPCSFLILSPPGMGKTTLLRDIIRQMSDGGVKVAVADERGELAACAGGIPTLDVGRETDVLDGCPKARAIPMLVRSMSPVIVATDELGDGRDAQAVREAARCGVQMAATAHAMDLEDGKKRDGIGGLIRDGLFQRLVILKTLGGKKEIRDVDGRLLEIVT